MNYGVKSAVAFSPKKLGPVLVRISSRRTFRSRVVKVVVKSGYGV